MDFFVAMVFIEFIFNVLLICAVVYTYVVKKS